MGSNRRDHIVLICAFLSSDLHHRRPPSPSPSLTVPLLPLTNREAPPSIAKHHLRLPCRRHSRISISGGKALHLRLPLLLTIGSRTIFNSSDAAANGARLPISLSGLVSRELNRGKPDAERGCSVEEIRAVGLRSELEEEGRGPVFFCGPPLARKKKRAERDASRAFSAPVDMALSAAAPSSSLTL
ncbi:hypothetical protein F0562_032336 [Nyssa sinensis]|uniref:Uncharacterized protein n=1 Tax=Nyssa sinensis TaxID=561372 RepID=A0A5J5AMS7_9ASTE|nr:hypothetical protein F0562_032336 [Nyssa sinensis]